MRNGLFVFVAVLVTQLAIAEERVAVDFRCLSGGPNDSIRLEWRTFIDVPTKWIGAYVKYKNSQKPISLVLRTEEATQKPDGRPWEFTSTWLEIVQGRITGEYEVVSQGANIYSFVYRNKRNGKSIDLIQDNAAYDVDNCKWE